MGAVSPTIRGGGPFSPRPTIKLRPVWLGSRGRGGIVRGGPRSPLKGEGIEGNSSRGYATRVYKGFKGLAGAWGG